MKKIYPILFTSLVIASCSKDVFKNYEDRLVGTWHLVDVDRRGLGGSLNNLPFTAGDFTFQQGGRLVYNDPGGAAYEGSWDLSYRTVSNGCSIDENGNQDCSERHVRSLHVTVIDFTNQDVKSETFEEIDFFSTNRWKAKIHSGLHTYVFTFRR
jgi:hypothetical protein